MQKKIKTGVQEPLLLGGALEVFCIDLLLVHLSDKIEISA